MESNKNVQHRMHGECINHLEAPLFPIKVIDAKNIFNLTEQMRTKV
jgi:hypothetical protein